MANNIYSLGLLRNSKVYANKELAVSNLKKSPTNDGVAKLARYLSQVNDETVIKTLIGFYANASEMEDASSGNSFYTIIDIDSIIENINLVNEYQLQHSSNTDIHVTNNDKQAWNLKADVSDIPDVSHFIDGVEYESDGVNHSIVFYHGNTYIDSIDVNPFLVDGMIDDVRIEDGKLVIDFNTASGKQDIYIPLTDIFDAEAYYTKAEVDALLQAKENEIYSLKKIVGDIGGNVTYDLPGEGKSFNTLMNNNGTVKLSEDVETSRFGPGITAKNHVTLNLNNHNLTITGLSVSSSTAAILARGTQEITIGGKGTIDAIEGICITVNGKDAVINLTGSTTTYHTNRPNGELIYCYIGTINITNGTFRNDGTSNYTLNCYDANYKNGTAKIIVSGGKFYDFDPGNNKAEGEGTSFLAEGYHTEASTVVEEGVEHTVYTVKKD